MPSLQFLDTNKKSLVSGTNFYLWDASVLPSSSQFPSKTAPPPATCGKLDSKGNLQAIAGIQLELPKIGSSSANVSIPECKATPVKVGTQGLQAGLLRTYFLLSQQELQAVTIDDVEQIALSSANPQLTTPLPPTPVVNLRFFVLSSIALPEGTKSVLELIFPWVSFLQLYWTPPETGPTAKFLVTFQWDRTYRAIDDSQNAFKRIDFFLSGSSRALDLVKANWSNPHFNPDIPIFVCNAAWDESNDPPGPPHDGRTAGHTLAKQGTPWFTGERAILLFIHGGAGYPDTLAHEMAHWVGFSHAQSEALGADNIGRTGGGGTVVATEQFAKLYKWATIRGFRRFIP